MVAHELSALLAVRLEPPKGLAATLVSQGILSEAAINDKLRSYYQWLCDPPGS